MDAPAPQLADSPEALVAAHGPRGWSDWLGVGASILCAIHCAAMPLVIGLLPLLGLGFLAEPDFHRWMVGVCLLLAVLAFWPGWRQHGRLVPGTLAIFGLVIIATAAFGGEDKCCPPAVDAPTTVTAQSVASMKAVAPTEEVSTCAAGGCAGCETSDEASDVAAATDTDPAQANSLLWHAATPIGSVFLIAGHILNRRYGRCCPTGC